MGLDNNHKKCFSADTLFEIEMYQGELMFVVDIVIITMPIPTIWKLQMPLKNRLVIISLFSLGLIACAASLARLPTLSYQKNATDFSCKFTHESQIMKLTDIISRCGCFLVDMDEC